MRVTRNLLTGDKMEFLWRTEDELVIQCNNLCFSRAHEDNQNYGYQMFDDEVMSLEDIAAYIMHHFTGRWDLDENETLRAGEFIISVKRCVIEGKKNE
jgi:uncharacterized protein YacL (UPF0231 family)